MIISPEASPQNTPNSKQAVITILLSAAGGSSSVWPVSKFPAQDDRIFICAFHATPKLHIFVFFHR